MAPSLEHEAICELFRRAEPELLFTLLGYAGVVLPWVNSVQDASEESGELMPTSFVADVVLTLGEGDSAHVLILEVQRAVDPDKCWSWPVYLATVRARHRCACVLVVVTPRADVARWVCTHIPYRGRSGRCRARVALRRWDRRVGGLRAADTSVQRRRAFVPVAGVGRSNLMGSSFPTLRAPLE